MTLHDLWRPSGPMTDFSAEWWLVYWLVAILAGALFAWNCRNTLTRKGQFMCVIAVMVSSSATGAFLTGRLNILEDVLIGMVALALPAPFYLDMDEDSNLAEWEKANLRQSQEPQSENPAQVTQAETDEDTSDIETVRRHFEAHTGSTP